MTGSSMLVLSPEARGLHGQGEWKSMLNTASPVITSLTKCIAGRYPQ